MSYLAFGILFAFFNLIAFVIPTEKTAMFWTAYAFSIIAFVVQIPLWKIVLDKNGTQKCSQKKYASAIQWATKCLVN